MQGIIFVSIAVVVVIPLVIALVVWQRRLAAARSEALKSIATNLRAEFRPDGPPDLAQSLATLPLCSKRARGKLSNLLSASQAKRTSRSSTTSTTRVQDNPVTWCARRWPASTWTPW